MEWQQRLLVETLEARCKQQLLDIAASSDNCRWNTSASLSLRRTYPIFEQQVPETQVGAYSERNLDDGLEHSVVTNKDIAEARYATLSLLEPWLPEANPEHERAKTFRTWRSRRDIVMLTCSMTSVVIFSLNLVCTIYFQVKWGQEDDINAIYEGDCFRTAKINTGLHVMINILSTLLLGASNMCMQLLAAPTCFEIDRAHGKHIWLDIGIPSLRNLKYIHRGRLAVLIILGLSSIPLHFL